MALHELETSYDMGGAPSIDPTLGAGEVIAFPRATEAAIGDVALSARERILEGYRISVRQKALTAEEAVTMFNTWDPENPISQGDIIR